MQGWFGRMFSRNASVDDEVQHVPSNASSKSKTVVELLDADSDSEKQANSATPTANRTKKSVPASAESAGSNSTKSAPKENSVDKSGMFRIVHINPDNRNRLLACLMCKEEVWHSHARAHILKAHPDKLQEYEKAKSKTVVNGRLAFNRAGEDETPEQREYRERTEGTGDNLNLQIAQLLILKKVPLNMVEFEPFMDTIRTAINFGARGSQRELETYKIPSRRHLIEKVVEGENGLLQQYVAGAIDRLQSSCTRSGASLIYDGAKDANANSVELFCLQSGSASTILWTGLPHTEKKSSEWTTGVLRNLLDKKMDFDELDGEVEGEDVDEAESRQSKKPRIRTHLTTNFERLFDFTQYVVAAGGDNAKVPVIAAKNLEAERGVLPFGCVAHALSRCFQHLCEIKSIKNEIVGKVSDIADFFLTRSMPRELLRAENGKSVDRIIPTRFISVFLVIERLLELRTDLTDVVSSQKMKKYIRSSKTPPSVKTQYDRVKSSIEDDFFWDKLDFFLKMTIGFVVAVRCIDGAKAGSVCLVYRMWELLSGTVAHAFINSVPPSCEDFATPELYEDIKRVIIKDWAKFHFPVYSAGFFLCPQFHAELNDIKNRDAIVFQRLLDDTLHCLIQFYRRFDEDGLPRPEVLPVDNEGLMRLKVVLRKELLDYVDKAGVYVPRYFTSESLVDAPSVWWQVTCVRGQLRAAAIRITSLSPATTPVERLHKVTKSTRTKTRNRLGYARALGMNFICCEYLLQKVPADESFSWATLKNYKMRIETLSADDRAYLEGISAAAANEQASQDLIEAEEMVATVESLVREAHAEQADGSCSDDEDVEDDTDTEGLPNEVASADIAFALNSTDVDEGEPGRRSSRGRLIRPKLFPGYVTDRDRK